MALSDHTDATIQDIERRYSKHPLLSPGLPLQDQTMPKQSLLREIEGAGDGKSKHLLSQDNVEKVVVDCVDDRDISRPANLKVSMSCADSFEIKSTVKDHGKGQDAPSGKEKETATKDDNTVLCFLSHVITTKNITHTHMKFCTHTRKQTQSHTFSLFLSLSLCVLTYTHVPHTYTHTHMHTNTHTHTHTHTHTRITYTRTHKEVRFKETKDFWFECCC